MDDPSASRRWWTLCVLSLCVVVITVDNTVLNVALPTIVRDVGATGSQLQWIVDAYTIVFACLLLTAGSLGDRYGRKHALTLGLVWFGTFSALASMASSPTTMIVARGLMGLGAAFIYPTTLSIITNTFHVPSERARAIGIWAGVSGIGAALGPLLGGVLVEHLGWPSVFLVNVPLCAAAVLLGQRFVPNSSSRDESPLDPLGAVLSVFALVAALFAIIEAPDRGWTSTVVMATFATGVVFVAAFVWWERHTARPMLDVRIFKDPRFSAASATVTIMQFAMFGATFLLTQYFQFRLGYSPLKAGLMLMPVAIGLMVAAPNASKLVNRFGTTRVVIIGLSALAFGTACYMSDLLMSSFALGILIRLVYGVGMGIAMPPMTESIMGSLPPARAGVGSAMNDTTRQAGGALGVAVIGSIFAFRYHHAIDTTVGVSRSVLNRAHDSIGVSLEVARQLHGATRAHLVEAARQSFVSSMRLTFAVTTVVVLVAAAVAARFLPPRGAETEYVMADHQVARGVVIGVETIT